MKNKIIIGVLFITMLFVSCNLGINNKVTKNEYENNNHEVEKPNIKNNNLNVFASFDAEKPEKVIKNYFILSTKASFDEQAFIDKGFEVKAKLPVRGDDLVFWYIYAENIKSLHAFKAIQGVTSASWETEVEAPYYTVNKPEEDENAITTFGTGITEPDPVDNAQGYSLKNTRALEAYAKFGYGDNLVFAGIIDTGTNMMHADLDDVVLYAKSCATSNPNNYHDQDGNGKFTEIPLGENWDNGGHGTHCSGTICAKHNGKAINGVAYKNVKLISYQGLGAKGGGSTWAIYGAMIDLVDTVEILRKAPVDRTQDEIDFLPSYLRDGHADIQITQKTVPVNMSLGGSFTSAYNLYAMTYAIEHDVLPVIAMGNEGAYTNSYPAALPGMLSVGAIDGKDFKAVFSTKGSWINICAPGVGIESCLNNTPYTSDPSEKTQNMSGTSMATPFITGTIAYLLSFNNARVLSPYQIITLLENTAEKINGMGDWTDAYGYGRVDVYKAAEAVTTNAVPALNERYSEAKLTITAKNNGDPIPVPQVLILDPDNVPVVCLPGNIDGSDFVIKGLKVGKSYTVKCSFGGDVLSESVTISTTDKKLEFPFTVPMAYVSTVKSLHYNAGADKTDTMIAIYKANATGDLDTNAEPILKLDQDALDIATFRYEPNTKYYAKIGAYSSDDGTYLGGNYVLSIFTDPLDIEGVDITDGTRLAKENDSHEADNTPAEAKAKGNAWNQKYACNLLGTKDTGGNLVEDYDWFYFETP